MMQVAVCEAAATVLRSSFRQVPKVFMSLSGAKWVRLAGSLSWACFRPLGPAVELRRGTGRRSKTPGAG